MIAKSLMLIFLLMPGMALADAPRMRCFSTTQLNGWRSPDGKTVYLRVGANDYYQLELAKVCSTLKTISPQLILQNRQGGPVCSALDLDVRASEPPGGIPEPCLPKTLRQLSPAEAAALPRDAKP